ncbi:LysR family transcriptional regulator [Pseudogemmobacter bohemicus]|uniref:LysR family transcriptional regulator n=1 Tax=Pseudogemmobacter bohemicus TaxID=2250708 RepID=UPI000DD3401C|nr:LysR family transcriptional regulator [Pseudogemmobacter bohemicus]
MELQLVRTFMETAETGSFAAASERLFVTQSAVSLRIQRLEDQLGRPLFTRSKDGVALTAAGREFRGFAITILRNWEQARLRVSATGEDGFRLVIGSEPSLWPRLGFGWMDLLRARLPDLALRAEMARAETLTQNLLQGGIDVALSYSIANRPGIHAEQLLDDQLVMVSSRAGLTTAELSENYALVDWGPEFIRFHEEALPALHGTRLQLAFGSLAALFIQTRPFAAYLPARHAKRFLDLSQLYPVADAPVFNLPVWSLWRDDIGEKLLCVAKETLLQAAAWAVDTNAEVLAQRET